jgi:CHASE2 domain-containing sensor protein
MSNLGPHRTEPSLSRGVYVAVALVVIVLLVAGFLLMDAGHTVWGLVPILAAAGSIAVLAYRR